MAEITLRLEDDALTQLLDHGDFVLRVWIDRAEDEPGVFKMHATVPSDPSTEALLRVIVATADHAGPPVAEPSAEVVEQMKRWSAHLEELDTSAS